MSTLNDTQFTEAARYFTSQRKERKAFLALDPDSKARVRGFVDAAGYELNRRPLDRKPLIDLGSTHEEIALAAAKNIAAVVREKPNAVLGLATGGTPVPMYEALIRMHKDGLDLSNVTTFNLDEYVGLNGSQPQSYRSYMDNTFFNHVKIKRENTHVPDGTSSNLTLECARYDEAMTRAGGIDIQVLGIGGNGHIGFCEPGTPFGKGTHVVHLTEETRYDNARYFGDNIDAVPKQAITMGPNSVVQAKRIIMLANGPAKLNAVSSLLNAPINTGSPATVLRRHEDVTLFVDRAAFVGNAQNVPAHVRRMRL